MDTVKAGALSSPLNPPPTRPFAVLKAAMPTPAFAADLNWDGKTFAVSSLFPGQESVDLLTISSTIIAQIRKLRAANITDRGEAAEALADLGPAAVPQLIEALSALEVHLRGGAAEALGRIGPGASAAVPALCRALQDRSPIVRWGAAFALSRIGPGAEAIPILSRKLLNDREYRVRAWCAYALGQIAPEQKEVLQTLVAALNDRCAGVRSVVKRVLGEIKGVHVAAEQALATKEDTLVELVSEQKPEKPQPSVVADTEEAIESLSQSQAFHGPPPRAAETPPAISWLVPLPVFRSPLWIGGQPEGFMDNELLTKWLKTHLPSADVLTGEKTSLITRILQKESQQHPHWQTRLEPQTKSVIELEKLLEDLVLSPKRFVVPNSFDRRPAPGMLGWQIINALNTETYEDLNDEDDFIRKEAVAELGNLLIQEHTSEISTRSELSQLALLGLVRALNDPSDVVRFLALDVFRTVWPNAFQDEDDHNELDTRDSGLRLSAIRKLIRLLPEIGEALCTFKAMKDREVQVLTPDPHEQLRKIDAKYGALREETRQALEQLLAEKAGKGFPSLEARQAFAAQVRELLQRFDLRLECPSRGCHQPATLRAGRFGNSKVGVFQFVHGSPPNHGGCGTLPSGLKVIDAPPDRRVKYKAQLKPFLPHSA